MALDVWSEFKEQVRAQTDLVALIGETRAVIPQRGGREFKALCPFHDDHSPSMTINPERQTYRCWVCNEGGDCFSYTMKLENLDFRQTLERLAERAGLELPKTPGNKKLFRARQANGHEITKADVLEALEWACQQYHQCLLEHPEAEPARDYLLDRGFCEEIWTDFRLGFHPGPWEWLLTRGSKKFSPALLEEAGLVKARQSGQGHYDLFRERVMFPIGNERKQIIAFGGRILPANDDKTAGKYINSAESALFHKGRQLYGIEHASQAMRDLGKVIVVEGYTDCIALHQVGIPNVVATLGTALTAQHVQLISRFCKEVILVFDGDTAGQNAASRALPILLSFDIDLKLFAIPESLDPPEYLERYGLQEFQKLLQNAADAWEYKLNQLTQLHGVESSHSRDQIVQEMLEILAVAPSIQATPRENYLLNRLANRVGLRGAQDQVLYQKLKEIRAKGSAFASAASRNSPSSVEPTSSSRMAANSDLNFREEVTRLLKEKQDRITTLERDLLEIIIMLPECITLLRGRELLQPLRNAVLNELLCSCESLQEQNQYSGIDSLLIHLEQPEWKTLVLGLVARAESRKITEKLQETVEFPAGKSCPVYLRQVIEQLEWEHKESHHRKSLQRVVDPKSEPTAVDDRMRQLLQDAAQFHQQRVTRKTAST